MCITLYWWHELCVIFFLSPALLLLSLLSFIICPFSAILTALFPIRYNAPSTNYTHWTCSEFVINFKFFNASPPPTLFLLSLQSLPSQWLDLRLFECVPRAWWMTIGIEKLHGTLCMCAQNMEMSSKMNEVRIVACEAAERLFLLCQIIWYPKGAQLARAAEKKSILVKRTKRAIRHSECR